MRSPSLNAASVFPPLTQVRVKAGVVLDGRDWSNMEGVVTSTWEKCEVDPHCCCAELATEGAVRVDFDLEGEGEGEAEKKALYQLFSEVGEPLAGPQRPATRRRPGPYRVCVYLECVASWLPRTFTGGAGDGQARGESGLMRERIVMERPCGASPAQPEPVLGSPYPSVVAAGLVCL
jgi:hypothetical protein